MSNQFTSENINEIAGALSKAQGEISATVMDKVNPFFKSRYSSLNAFWDACRKPLSNNGLSLSQCTFVEGENLLMATTLLHSSGQWIRSYFPVCNTKSTVQAMGSAITYSRRYTLAAIVGLSCDEDDDGNAGNNVAPVTQKKQEKEPVKPVETINEEQVQYLMNLCNQCDPWFYNDILIPKLKTYKLECISDIPVQMFKNVEAFINKAIQEKNKDKQSE